MTRALASALGIASAMLALGCGGGAPLMHGAHALGPGMSSSGAGFSGTFTTGTPREVLQTGSGARTSDMAAEATAVRAAMAPAVAPWVGGRVGIAGDNEAGLAFTGRSARVDARHAFESGALAFSVGAGGSATWRSSDPIADGAAPRFRIQSGYGVDVPILMGWRSDAGVVSVWGGARGGLESLRGSITGNGFPWEVLSDVDLLRSYVGGVAGLAMGLRHVHVALELDVLYQAISGDWSTGSADLRVKVDGITLAPAGALIFTF